MAENFNYNEIGAFVSSGSTYGDVDDSYWGVMGGAICNALGARKEHCLFISPRNEQLINFLFDTMRANIFPKYFLFFNFMPRAISPEDAGSGESMFDPLPARIIRVLLDHPVHVGNAVRKQVAVIEKNPSLRPLRNFTVMEANHIPALEELGISREQIFVMPQGGPDVLENAKPQKDRTIPLLFSGSISPVTPNGEFAVQIGCGDLSLRGAVDDSVAETLDGDRDVFEIVTDRLAAPIADGTVQDACQLVLEIDRRARTIRRHRLFSTLRDLPIRFYGNISDDFKKANKNGTFAGNLSWLEILNCMSDSRIVINDTINLRESALIRVFYAIAHGAVVATEMNRFLTRSFADREAVVALDHPGDENADRIRTVLENPAIAQSMVDRAREIYADSHTWEHRMDALIEAIRS